MMKSKIGILIIVLLLLALLTTMMVGLTACGEKDRDPSHYNYYTCTHCHGSGRTQSGSKCGYCDGTGMYAVKKAEYEK